MGVLGGVAGLRVIEDDRLGYDEMYIATTQQAIAVGEYTHFRYRIEQINENHRLRQRAADHIQRSAERILGEPWEIAST